MTVPVVERMLALLLRGVFAGLRAIGPVAASNLAGGFTRRIGPWLPVTRVAETNLRHALPELDADARAAVIRRVWENLGRTVGELPHLREISAQIELVGGEYVTALNGGPVLFFSGHFGNWEAALPAAAGRGLRLAGIYRPASNRAVDAVITALRDRATGHDVPMFAKGASGARAVLTHLGQGGSLGLLVDQKMNDGIAVPFFGRPAMTAPALAQFARLYRLTVLPARVERIGPARLRLVCEAPLTVPRTANRQADTLALMTAVNATFERWIRADPGGWLWLHRRWPKESAAEAEAPTPDAAGIPTGLVRE